MLTSPWWSSTSLCSVVRNFAETHVFLGRDLFQRVPERHFEPDRRAVAADSQRTGLRFIVALRLMREQMAHGVPPGGLSFFRNDIPACPASQCCLCDRRDATVAPTECEAERQCLQHDNRPHPGLKATWRFARMHLPPQPSRIGESRRIASEPSPMPVRQLPEQVVNRIAAGEVVERPASVVKELVENAIDAGASRIDVFTDGGGRRRIGITDDGGGMTAGRPRARRSTATPPPSSTTRISCGSARSGFRGEALPSIGAVAKLASPRVMPSEPHAWSLSVEGGAKSEDHAGRARPRHPRRGQRSLLCDAGAAEISEDRPHRGRGDPRGGAAARDGAARYRLHAGRRGARAGDLGRGAARRARPADAARRYPGRGLSQPAPSRCAPSARASWSKALPPRPR